MKLSYIAFVLSLSVETNHAFQRSSSINNNSVLRCKTATIPLRRKRISSSQINHNSRFKLFSKNEETSSSYSSNPVLVANDESRQKNGDITLVTDSVSSSSLSVVEKSMEGPLTAITNPPVEGGIDPVYQEAIKRTAAWVSLAGVFGLGLWYFMGPTSAQEFFASYIVEQSLSVDNLFVFLLLFDFFRVPLEHQNKVLTWGIYGSIIMRATMITLGGFAIEFFRPVLLVFAGILVYSSAQILLEGDGDDDEEDMNDNTIVKFSRRIIDSTNEFDGDNFFTIVDDGVRKATPLFLCMIAIEISDIVFAIDSIPAVFGVTKNIPVVFSSNMFAIMGLRSLYMILSKAATDMKYLESAVAAVLGFIGSKMIAEYFGYEIPTASSLMVVASLLGVGIGASIFEKNNNPKEEEAS